MQRSQPCSSRFSQKLVKWESFDEILTFFLYFEPYFASLRQNVDHRLFEMWLLLNLFNKLWPAMVFLLQTAARRIILPLKCGPPISLKLRLRHATTVWKKVKTEQPLIFCRWISPASRARSSWWRTSPLYEARPSVTSRRWTNYARSTETSWWGPLQTSCRLESPCTYRCEETV